MRPPLRTRIAAEVRRARKERGWSQLKLAERAGLSAQYISLVERAKQTPSLEVLLQLADVLGTTLERLVYGPPPTDDEGIGEAASILQGLPAQVRRILLAMLRAAGEVAGAAP